MTAIIIATFLFFGRWDNKEIGCSFEVPLFPVLSLNSNSFYQCFLLVLFACKDPYPFFKILKTRNHLKTENLETLFLLLAFKVSILSSLSLATKQK